MTPRSKVLGYGTIGRQKAMRLPRRLKALHALFPLAGGLVGILRAVVEVTVLAVLHPGQQLPLGGAVALELIGDDHPWHIGETLEQLTEEFLRSSPVLP